MKRLLPKSVFVWSTKLKDGSYQYWASTDLKDVDEGIDVVGLYSLREKLTLDRTIRVKSRKALR